MSCYVECWDFKYNFSYATDYYIYPIPMSFTNVIAGALGDVGKE